MSSSPATRGPFVGSMMRVAHQWVIEHVYARVLAAGYTDLSRAQVSIFHYPTPDGLRPTELAAVLEVTKQSVNSVLRDMEALGYLRVVRDARDGRARVIRLTAKGRRLETVVYDGAESAAGAFTELLGPRRFTQLHDALEQIVGAARDHRLPHVTRKS